jgi:hypothetical protein
MSTFNGDEYIAGLEPPRFILGGREYVGQVLSVPQWLKLATVYSNVDDKGDPKKISAKSLADQQKAIKRVVDLMFPRVNRWNPFERRASAAFCTMPIVAQFKAVQGFLKSQERLVLQLASEPGE